MIVIWDLWQLQEQPAEFAPCVTQQFALMTAIQVVQHAPTRSDLACNAVGSMAAGFRAVVFMDGMHLERACLLQVACSLLAVPSLQCSAQEQ